MHSLPFCRLHSKPACAAADGCACPVLEACASSPQVDSGGDCRCTRGQPCICEGVAAPLAPVPIMPPLPPHAPPPPLQGVSEGACGCVRDQHPRGHGGSTRQWALGRGERCMGCRDGPAGGAHTGVTGVFGGGGHGGRHLGCRDGPTGGALRARLTYGHVVTVGAALSYTPAVWPPLQTHLMYSHVFTIGLCFLVARVMTPWQRVILHLDRWGGVLGGACLDHTNVTAEYIRVDQSRSE